jgi:hypothetical protein
MDDTAQDTGESDAFARLLAQLNAPTTEAVSAVPASAAPSIDAPLPPTRAPELRGADELAAPPHPFPPLPVAATPLIAPPAPPSAAATPTHAAPAHVAPAHLAAPQLPAVQALTPQALTPQPLAAASPTAPSSTAPPAAAHPPAVPDAPAPSDFSQLLVASAPAPATMRASPPLGVSADVPDESDIARSTVGEKITLLLAILLPPLGLLAAIVGAILSARRRGWVIGLLRASIAIGVVLSIVAGIGGYLEYTMVQQQQAHDRTAAASAAFCSTIKADPTMIASPTFGWPAVASTITDSLTGMQAYADKWTKLAKVSPDGIRPEVVKVATAATQIINSVTVGRTVDDASNISVMTATASASGVPGWYAEYCR